MEAAAALALLLLAQDAALFEEKFGSKLGEGWTWIREDAAAWKLGGGALKVKCLPGSIWYKRNDAKNFLMRRLPAAATEAGSWGSTAVIRASSCPVSPPSASALR